ncbi:hypothetical protein Scep_026886 [Stephania cephalantha]|uniref:Uncharacterized protein n=1 Tax=Stephania cephalantha TaxID=152367 RepID=A0AAP0ERA4_9MAGN
MATYAAMKPTKAGFEDTQQPEHRIRITLSSKSVKNLEKVTQKLYFPSSGSAETLMSHLFLAVDCCEQ